MPPPTHAPWRALAFRPAPTRTSATSTAATTAPRLFHTTRPLAAFNDEVPTPPESPNFFSLPTLLQSDETKKPRIKGRLPVPRAIFSKRAAGAHKISPRFIRRTAALSAAELAGKPPKSDKDAWKRLMAASRRTALDEGIGNLWRRKQYRERSEKARSAARQQAHVRAATAPAPADEVHTRSTVTQATLTTAVVRDPLYAERQRASIERTKAIQAAESEARKDAVQRLYVEASSFILTEEDLTARIERLFHPDYFKWGSHMMASTHEAKNVWQSHGSPKSIWHFIQDLEGTFKGSYTAHKTTIRQRELTGELTGGALSVIAPAESEKAEFKKAEFKTKESTF